MDSRTGTPNYANATIADRATDHRTIRMDSPHVVAVAEQLKVPNYAAYGLLSLLEAQMLVHGRDGNLERHRQDIPGWLGFASRDGGKVGGGGGGGGGVTGLNGETVASTLIDVLADKDGFYPAFFERNGAEAWQNGTTGGGSSR